MTCTECEARLSAYVDGELKEEETPAMFGHLGGCADCREALRGFLALRRAFQREAAATGTTPHRPLPAPDRPARAGVSLLRRRVSVPVLVLTALAAAVLIGGILVFGRGAPEREVIYISTLPTVNVVSTGYTPTENHP